MKKLKEKILSAMTRTFDLPSEVTMQLPRITTIGSIHAYIENHQGLVVFSSNELLLKVHQGHVRIKGEDFVLKTMIEKDILLEGSITAITYEKS
ncbi:sporulation protein YqfC [Gracilibacillus sp. S3-1-1]|uniref:Sporulation protein YqfC n=1 Tax=Gracilibacillus pellucidus TaxID=3095368 RepID=A0ACC6M540_9BACI|nr:sporulation protein YqfC [Gracilibacillus sp. S3-1-1]MDX8045947.1 sporulation protein YqfC [Gracilibacillus sp. S3-1-1]